MNIKTIGTAAAADISRLQTSLMAALPPAINNEWTLIIASFAPADSAAVAACLPTIGGRTMIAAQISAHFPFIKPLRARTEAMWQQSALVIPPLNNAANIDTATQLILTALAANTHNIAAAAATDAIDMSPATTLTPSQAAMDARSALQDIL